MAMVDIVVPVHHGLEAARRCVESILESRNQTDHELIVVDDATREPELAAYLRDLAARGDATLLVQPVREGFAVAVNRALGLHRDRDVVVVHADAEVANNWLDRLAWHARAPGIGTVTTFTNAYGVATYPQPRVPNPLPAGYDLGVLDTLFARANARSSTALPIVFGPCVYFRRDCLAAVGALDASPLGSDYGVVNDFCLRASIAGFVHLLAGDVFVMHADASTRRNNTEALRQRSEFALEQLYPDYPAQKAMLAEREPQRPFSRRVDLLRLAESDQPIVVFVSHPWGGGIRRHMNDLAELIADDCTVLYLEPANGDSVKLYWPREGESFVAYFALPSQMSMLTETLHAIGVSRLHFHHVHRLPQAILDLPAASGIPYDCTLHDYYSICPQYHLVDEQGRYCGEPDAAGCTACLARRPAQWGVDIATWRSMLGGLLLGAQRVIAPSNDVSQRVQRYFPGLRVEVWPHPESHAVPAERVVRVVVLGNLSPEKGLNVVAACARDAKARHLPLTYRVLGSTTEPIPQAPDVSLTIYGQYDDADLAAMLAAEKPDVVWFPAQVPETYSYTLSVALASGVPIVASALGALPERLASYPRHATLAWDAPASDWNAALIEAARGPQRSVPAQVSAIDEAAGTEVSS